MNCRLSAVEKSMKSRFQMRFRFQNAPRQRNLKRETHCQQTNPFEGIGFAKENRERSGRNVTLSSRRTSRKKS
ncbi:hypothetical protein RB5412 [Rhodopirellula baltica SH 1]|uniref:Uncharacterized protein n=1 Tax=Rhodopirellula baltica (strain DSM 10527 / NCIMB 13988 / SH1) TaxID=243090 RepID=Q7URW7_RHOBA|nr:hypothetical protein RB5412 [Rhodopirellula baltica SH 1]